MLKFYGYSKCSTCRKAKAALIQNQIPFEEIDITTFPPSFSDLKTWLASGKFLLKEFLNTSGIEYRAQKISEKVKTHPPEKILELLAKNGRLLKRPIMADGKKASLGFKDPDAVIRFWKMP